MKMMTTTESLGETAAHWHHFGSLPFGSVSTTVTRPEVNSLSPSNPFIPSPFQYTLFYYSVWGSVRLAMKNFYQLQCKLTMTIYAVTLPIIATTFHLNPPLLDSCTAGCLIPTANSTIWLPYSYPPCLHPGEPVLRWSNATTCNIPNFLTSRSVFLDSSSGMLFAKKRVCFYVEPWHVEYSYNCSDNYLQQSAIFLDHKKYATKRRSKRWMRRRNPTVPRIHFQQERYITEIPEDIPINSLIIKVHATHITNESMYYAMVAPEDSRSANIFTLDTVSGEISLIETR
ncbi:unnamed protein product [Onchocerca flexuosa]|uniref:Cadherin domain-containing protein n=1 Tax=Onchocerca flexuosa TaxID=387005 RepID=A0A183HA39_9BILA|nr:unnamed protein product [Onchocerca flexuosa]